MIAILRRFVTGRYRVFPASRSGKRKRRQAADEEAVTKTLHSLMRLICINSPLLRFWRPRMPGGTRSSWEARP